MAGINKVILIGNLGKDPEVRHTQSGQVVANLRLATTETYKDREGNRQERTEWVSVVIWGPLAEVVEKYAKKGSKLYIEGKLQTRKWQDQSGADRYSTEVVVQGYGAALHLLDRPTGNGGGNDDRPRQGGGTTRREDQGGYGGGRSHSDPDDDIPF